jgi:hypothetical protein
MASTVDFVSPCSEKDHRQNGKPAQLATDIEPGSVEQSLIASRQSEALRLEPTKRRVRQTDMPRHIASLPRAYIAGSSSTMECDQSFR